LTGAEMREVESMGDDAAFRLTIATHPGCDSPRLVYADWLSEQGRDWESVAWRTMDQPSPMSQLLPIDYYSIGIGSGSGSGRGIGNGIGIGIGIGSGRGIGIGISIGIGSGSGSGRGIGSGSGRGIGIGIGSGRGNGNGRGENMELGKAYMVTTVDWFAWVGRPVEQVGPFEWRFEKCSKISDTGGGDIWHKLAEGDDAARRRATFIHYKTGVILGMGVVAKIEWTGNTPQEDGLRG
jgi:uncharacterized protein (TIGR02996 family)